MRGLRNEEFDLAVIEHRLDQDFAGFDRFSMPDDEMLVVAAPSADIPNVDGVIQLSDLKNSQTLCPSGWLQLQGVAAPEPAGARRGFR